MKLNAPVVPASLPSALTGLPAAARSRLNGLPGDAGALREAANRFDAAARMARIDGRPCRVAGLRFRAEESR